MTEKSIKNVVSHFFMILGFGILIFLYPVGTNAGELECVCQDNYDIYMADHACIFRCEGINGEKGGECNGWEITDSYCATNMICSSTYTIYCNGGASPWAYIAHTMCDQCGYEDPDPNDNNSN